MQRTPAGELFAVPIYVLSGIILLGVFHFIFSGNFVGPLNELPNAILLMALVIVPVVFATLPAYGMVVYLRRKGISLFKACGIFLIATLFIIGLLSAALESGKETLFLTAKMTAILTTLFATLESRRPRWIER